jgi:hypothetical protein
MTQGVPITQIRFPSSPSPLLDWLAAPVYTTASGQPTLLQPPAPSPVFPFGGLAGYATPHAGVDGHLFQGGPLMPTYSRTLACHASSVTARQRAELFVGSLPDHIRIDVEMRDPQDLQSVMHYARAYEQHALAMQQSFQGRGARPHPTPHLRPPSRRAPPCRPLPWPRRRRRAPSVA